MVNSFINKTELLLNAFKSGMVSIKTRLKQEESKYNNLRECHKDYQWNLQMEM